MINLQDKNTTISHQICMPEWASQPASLYVDEILKLPGRDGSWMGDYATCGSWRPSWAPRAIRASSTFAPGSGEYPVRTRLVC